MKNNNWLSAKVIHGQKRGKKLCFPTLNLDNPNLLTGHQEGVYAVKVSIEEKIYLGLLYFGPRLIWEEKEKVLEIFVFDFDKEIYGETVYFQIKEFIRNPKKFTAVDSLKKQLTLDCEKAKRILHTLVSSSKS